MNLKTFAKCGCKAVLRLFLHEPVIDKFIECMNGEKIVNAETCRKLGGEPTPDACIIRWREYS